MLWRSVGAPSSGSMIPGHLAFHQHPCQKTKSQIICTFIVSRFTALQVPRTPDRPTVVTACHCQWVSKLARCRAGPNSPSSQHISLWSDLIPTYSAPARETFSDFWNYALAFQRLSIRKLTVNYNSLHGLILFRYLFRHIYRAIVRPCKKTLSILRDLYSCWDLKLHIIENSWRA